MRLGWRGGAVLAVAAVVAALGPPVIAEAFSLGGFTGPVVIKFTDFTDSTLYANGTNCLGVAGCNAAAISSPKAGFNGEDSWFIARVATIQRADTFQTLWSDGTNGEEITLLGTGLVDAKAVIGGATGQGQINEIGNLTGIRIDAYLGTSSGPTAFNPTLGTAGRTAEFAYTTVTDGVPFLSLQLAPGARSAAEDAADGLTGLGLQTLLFETVNQNTPFKSHGSGFADVIPGSGFAADMFNTNGLTTFIGTQADIQLLFNADACPRPSGAGCGLTADWTTESNDPINALVRVPEPGILALLGLSLAGFGMLARRKR